MIDVYPLEFHLGPLEITGFGIMMMVAFMTAWWLVDQECRRNQIDHEYASDLLMGAMIGGILGAKLWFMAIHPGAPFFDRGGLVWYGGFVGGSLGVIVTGWRRRVPMRWTAQIMAPALAAGYALGRVGCFVVGDDYGRPSTLPWAMRFPQGKPISSAAAMQSQFGIPIPDGVSPDTIMAVHPTQLYEVTLMLVVFAILWRWRRLERGTGWLFGAYLIFAGLERFIIEFFRAKDDRFFGALTVAQLTSLTLIAIGAALVVAWGRQRSANSDQRLAIRD